jgi:hypothetical protein
MKLAGALFLLIAMLLLPPAAMAQGAAADKGEAAATAACKAKSDPSILVDYWKTVQVRAAAELTELENRAKAICLTRGGGNSGSYKISGRAGPMTVSGTACSLSKPFKTRGVGGSMEVEWVYTPSSENGGTLSYTGIGTGAAAGVRMAGKGTYSVKLDARGGSLTYVSTGRVTNPGGGGATNSTTLRLTPTGPC